MFDIYGGGEIYLGNEAACPVSGATFIKVVGRQAYRRRPDGRVELDVGARGGELTIVWNLDSITTCLHPKKERDGHLVDRNNDVNTARVSLVSDIDGPPHGDSC